MDLRFVAQPFAGDHNLFDFIQHATGDSFSDLRIAVAWAKRSGLGRVSRLLKDFRSRGGRVQMLVGVSEGGATVEGLELVLELADDPWIFHDPQRTFHPKLYLATGETMATLFVGSNNLTAGGVGWNYEAAIWVDCVYSPGAPGLIHDAQAWLNGLLDEEDVCKPLDAQLVSDLQASADISIGSEDAARRRKQPADQTPEDQDGQVSATISGIFSRPAMRMRPLVPQLRPSAAPVAVPPGSPALPTGKAGSGSRGGGALAVARMARAPVVAPTDDVVRRWYKEMDHTAAQVPRSPGSNPTGNLRLSQEHFDIDHNRHFVEAFFGGLPWTARPGFESEQEVEVAFDVYVAGANLGMRYLRVSHDPRRIAGQGNVATVLHWGELGAVLRAANYVGWIVTLERTLGSGFRLIISPAPTGAFIY